MEHGTRAKRAKLDATAFRLALNGWDHGTGALYRRLARAIETQIDEGVFRRGLRLPAERAVAEELAVSRGTVVRAYEHLVAKSLLTRRQGRGTTIAGDAPDIVEPRMVGSQMWSRPERLIDLRRGAVPSLPRAVEIVRRLDITAATSAHEDDLLGLSELRELIAARYCSEGLATTPHQILVTNGGQQSVSLVIGTHCRRGDVVLGEQNTWTGFINAVRLHGCSFRPIAMDAEGVIVEDLERLIAKFSPSLVVLNPQFQNPTGSCLPESRATAVAQLCEAADVPIFESRVNARIAFDHRHRPPIEQYGYTKRNFIGDSLSRVAWSGLSVGWLRADAEFVQRAKNAKAATDGTTSLPSQLLARALFERLDEVVDERIARQRAAADAAIDTLRAELPDWSFTTPRGGSVFWAELPGGASAERFCQHAADYGVALASCKNFSLCAGVRHVRIPFTAEPDVIREGLRRAGAAWRTFQPATTLPG